MRGGAIGTAPGGQNRRSIPVPAFIAKKRAQNIAVGSLRASARFVELIDAESEHVAAKVSQAILTSTGDIKGEGGQVAVNVGVSVGYVIDLSGGGGKAVETRTETPTQTIEHKP